VEQAQGDDDEEEDIIEDEALGTAVEDDVYIEEPSRLEALYDAFTSAYQITREELEEKFLNFPGDILSFYNYAEQFLHTTPAENRKNMKGRGRPKKIKTETVPKVLQMKRGRGRPKKIV
jgi:hypothetical protein